MRRLLAAVLVCEAIVIGLAIPVAISVAHADAGTAGIVGGALALACILLAGLLRFSWAVFAGGVLQVVMIATGFVVPTMFILGVVFGALWVTTIWLGRKVEGTEAR
ncbi:DUF4233 domain-containing protein [Actinomadura sp. HBU206391]|uniref:DUF4233 domain-containing protein n=1 Tax=Actinomadura sp. HBU206391 TaxID=2731692 RepID=UPI00164FCE11|nr:DUF4233 domain-containing protein [Actinomadura sp. HBU206391]MBC6461562.1 DUF4233 domain-containing protein [Actinomadura sp. HBU206391]